MQNLQDHESEPHVGTLFFHTEKVNGEPELCKANTVFPVQVPGLHTERCSDLSMEYFYVILGMD